MADFPGTLAPALVVDRTYAVTQGLFNYSLGAAVGPSIGPGAWATGGAVPPVPARASYAGTIAEEGGVGLYWFERVHILPRVKQALGVIAANQNVLFEVFNAHRYITAQLNTVANEIGAGVTIPDLPALPFALRPFASLLDPTSARLAPVRIEVVVARDGLPLFDGAFVFTFSTGDVVSLVLSGTRVSLIPLVYEAELAERWTFPDDPIEALNGTEQVVAIAPNPVQTFALTYLLDEVDRQRMQALLFGAQTQPLALPVWHEDVFTTAAASVAASSLAVSTTTDADFRVGGLAVVFESATKYDVLVLSSVATTSLGFTSTPLLNSYSTNARVAPVRLGYIVNDVTGTRFLNRLEAFRVPFQVIDNDVGMFAGDVSGWSSYNGRVLLDDCNVTPASGTATKFTQRVTVFDAGTGRIETFTNWQTNRRQIAKGFSARGRAAYRKLKRLLLALRGRQVAFYLPTFAEDLTPASDLLSSVSSIDVVHHGAAKFVQARLGRDVLRVTFTDGSSLVRGILSAAELSSTVERLTLDAAWPATRPVAEVARIEYFELVRFDASTFTFEHAGTGLVTLTAPTRTLNA